MDEQEVGLSTRRFWGTVDVPGVVGRVMEFYFIKVAG